MDRSDATAGTITINRWVSSVSALLVAMVLSRLIPAELYGQYAKLWLIYMVLVQSAISAIGPAVMQYLGKSQTQNNVAIQSIFLLAFILAFFMATLLFFGASNLAKWLESPSLMQPIKHFVPYGFFMVAAAPMEAVFIHRNRKKQFLRIMSAFHLLNVGLVLMAFVLTNNLAKVALFMSIGPLLRWLYFSTFCWSKHIHLPNLFTSIPLWSMLSLIAVLFANSLLSIGAQDLDKWLVANFFSDDASFAQYAIGARKLPFLGAIGSALSASLLASFAGASVGNWKPLEIKAKHFVSTLFPLYSAAIALSIALAPLIMKLLYSARYLQASDYFAWYQLGLLGDLIFGITLFLIMNNRKALIGLAALEFAFKALFTVIFLKFFGPKGAVIAYVISHIGFSLVGLFWSCKQYKADFFAFLPSRSSISQSLTIFGLLFASAWALQLLLNPLSLLFGGIMLCLAGLSVLIIWQTDI